MIILKKSWVSCGSKIEITSEKWWLCLEFYFGYSLFHGVRILCLISSECPWLYLMHLYTFLLMNDLILFTGFSDWFSLATISVAVLHAWNLRSIRQLRQRWKQERLWQQKSLDSLTWSKNVMSALQVCSSLFSLSMWILGPIVHILLIWTKLLRMVLVFLGTLLLYHDLVNKIFMSFQRKLVRRKSKQWRPQ